MNDPIVFFGSGPVAAESLRLLAQDFTVEAVITKPKPPHHHGDFPVLDLAQALGLTILTTTDKKDLSELFATSPVTSKLGIVIDYGIIIPGEVIDYFPLGIVNSHFSLLPQWRGADPITFSILSGQSKTGVSLMVIDAGLDTGKLITQKSLGIDASDTSLSLTSKLIALSHQLLCSHIPPYTAGTIRLHNQPHPDRVTFSRKLTKEDGIIDWSKPALQLEREIRAYIAWPKSRTTLGTVNLAITKSAVAQLQPVKPGELLIEKKSLYVGTGQDLLKILAVQPDNKKEMPIEAFLAGYRKYIQN